MKNNKTNTTSGNGMNSMEKPKKYQKWINLRKDNNSLHQMIKDLEKRVEIIEQWKTNTRNNNRNLQ